MSDKGVTRMFPIEPVVFDDRPVQLLVQNFGTGPAEMVADTTLEEIVILLASSEAAWAAGEFRRLESHAIELQRQAARIGLQSVAEVAKRVALNAAGPDAVALAALVARLARVGEASLAALWETGQQEI